MIEYIAFWFAKVLTEFLLTICVTAGILIIFLLTSQK